MDASLLSSPFQTDKPCYQKGPSKGPTTALFRFEAQAGFQAHSKNNNNINSNKYWEQKTVAIKIVILVTVMLIVIIVV